MTVEQLFAQMLESFPTLEQAGKIFFDHVEVQDGEEITPPYIVLTETNQDPFYADNTVYYMSIHHTIDLYTVLYDVELINRIGDFLNGLEIPFNVSTVEWQEDINAYLTEFEVELDPSEVES